MVDESSIEPEVECLKEGAIREFASPYRYFDVPRHFDGFRKVEHRVGLTTLEATHALTLTRPQQLLVYSISLLASRHKHVDGEPKLLCFQRALRYDELAELDRLWNSREPLREVTDPPANRRDI